MSWRKALTIGLLPGDGIGKEVVPAAQKVISHLLPSTEFKVLNVGFEHYQKTGYMLPSSTMKGLKYVCDGALFGAATSPSTPFEGYVNPMYSLQKELDLYAAIRRVRTPKQDPRNIDVLIIREYTEGVYLDGTAAWPDCDTIENASKRIGNMAFKMALFRDASRVVAQSQGQSVSWTQPPKVTIAYKKVSSMNILDNLFRSPILESHQTNPEFQKVTIEEEVIDSLLYRIYREPNAFDVVLARNFNGHLIFEGVEEYLFFFSTHFIL